MASRASEQQSIDLLEDIIAGLFQAADVNQQGYLTRDDYIQVCYCTILLSVCVCICLSIYLTISAYSSEVYFCYYVAY